MREKKDIHVSHGRREDEGEHRRVMENMMKREDVVRAMEDMGR